MVNEVLTGGGQFYERLFEQAHGQGDAMRSFAIGGGPTPTSMLVLTLAPAVAGQP